ncbi:helix-turn-helix domain-containing protein [Chitinophaga nivalis]|uniref:Helix-turn-helix domain-containing protein n=1 Tax=Chitinophaga nivalis TaxID=2991709 RepID=A0ABT3IF18_9BACT|nr:helix-turn-helix domain-containing protein [Chitinophaga nivalis]MCW3467757.1 helix-turn-helix domain-containing protein [Chitinophaga nivalis]MCW3482551.1 helix-turn-helix domain-containing protein [Chitinophaga nivalis]
MYKRSPYFDRIVQATPAETKNRIADSFAISEQVLAILEHKRISLTAFAKSLQVSPETVHNWMAGNHHFTPEIMLQIEQVLGEKILLSDYIHPDPISTKH